MLAKIQTLILQEEMNLMADPMSIIDVDGSSAIYLIFMVIGIIGYFCVPTVSNWIVQAGGMSSYNRNVNNTASKVTNVVGAAAGASTGVEGAGAACSSVAGASGPEGCTGVSEGTFSVAGSS